MGRLRLAKEARREAARVAEATFPGAMLGWKLRAFDVIVVRGFWGRLKWLVLGR